MNSLTLLLICLISFTGQQDSTHNQNTHQAGIALSFDDLYVDAWYEANQVFREYDWKATYFISRFDRLSEEQIDKLHRLKNEGHEIAAHGLHHIRATEYITENGMQAYLDYEINPMLELMHENNLYPTSFAYPYGTRNAATDSLLIDHFTILRGTSSGNPNLDSLRAFYNGSNVVWGLGIDSHRADYSIDYLISVLGYAKQHNKIVILYGHETVPEYTDRNQTEYKTLFAILDYIQNNDMRFYTMSELSSIR